MAQITVSTVATQIAAAVVGDVIVRNRGAVPMYIDFASTVTAATGFQLDPSESLTIDRLDQSSQQVWAIVGSSTARADVLIGTR